MTSPTSRSRERADSFLARVTRPCACPLEVREEADGLRCATCDRPFTARPSVARRASAWDLSDWATLTPRERLEGLLEHVAPWISPAATEAEQSGEVGLVEHLGRLADAVARARLALGGRA